MTEEHGQSHDLVVCSLPQLHLPGDPATVFRFSRLLLYDPSYVVILHLILHVSHIFSSFEYEVFIYGGSRPTRKGGDSLQVLEDDFCFVPGDLVISH